MVASEGVAHGEGSHQGEGGEEEGGEEGSEVVGEEEEEEVRSNGGSRMVFTGL